MSGFDSLNLFNGMGCGAVALQRAGIYQGRSYSSEIDKYAIKINDKNHPDTIQIGCIKEVKGKDYRGIDGIFAGSPCQGFSMAGKQLNFNDPRSKLFFDFLRILDSAKPKYFMLENVRMKKEYRDIITKYLGVEPILINSTLVSAQNRQRYYWSNIPGLSQPKDKGIVLRDILQDDGFGIIKNRGDLKEKKEKSQCLDANYFKGVDNHGQRTMIALNYSSSGRGDGVVEGRFYETEKAQTLTKTGYSQKSSTGIYQINPVKETPKGQERQPFMQNRVYHIDGKSVSITKGFADRLKVGTDCIDFFRKLTPIECERLQTLPDNYTEGVSNSQRYKMIGNGWTVDVVAHLFKGLK